MPKSEHICIEQHRKPGRLSIPLGQKSRGLNSKGGELATFVHVTEPSDLALECTLARSRAISIWSFNLNGREKRILPVQALLMKKLSE